LSWSASSNKPNVMNKRKSWSNFNRKLKRNRSKKTIKKRNSTRHRLRHWSLTWWSRKRMKFSYEDRKKSKNGFSKKRNSQNRQTQSRWAKTSMLRWINQKSYVVSLTMLKIPTLWISQGLFVPIRGNKSVMSAQKKN